MQAPPPRRRRARPVGDAPVDALLPRTEDIAKGWLLALLEQAPLDEAPTILGADLVRDGPRVCDAIVRALADDADLRRIEPGGALELLVSRVGEFGGGAGVDGALHAVDALHRVSWSAVREELRDPDADQVSELAERLSLVIELVRGATLRRLAGTTPDGVGAAAVAPAAPVAPAPAGAPRDAPAEPAAESAVAPPSGEALWVGAVQDEIARSQRSGAQLSLLLAELEDSDRVLDVESASEATATFGRFAQAVRSVVRRQDILACETDTRAWVIARETGRAASQALGSRIAEAVREAPRWRGVPMMVSVGIAVLGEDGHDADSLIGAAEEAKFAASARGIEVATGIGPDEPPERPEGAGPRLVS